MVSCHEHVFKEVLIAIRADPVVTNAVRPGFCRVWSGEVIKFIAAYEVTKCIVTPVAHEVDLEPGYSHTFVLLEITCNENIVIFVIDDIGTAKYAPYAGSLTNAPAHLLNSHIDIIQRYIFKGE